MRRIGMFFTIMLFTALVVGVSVAQDDTTNVTDDDVNAIAKQLYCPVCENIPLDTCGTAACEDWRYEIRLQLSEGMTQQEIIDDFVLRFGERVVGTPQDPTLRALSLVTPWFIALIAAVAAIYGLIRWRKEDKTKNLEPLPETSNLSNLQDLLERDLAE
ncbi:cytochrome c-type biogenesis protein CcmH [Phototrophicus methaneseepsis]|uniref:Cytochrome c-type biogenesis protein n=1 Tax=Phototrophicus methaneseepsis TaxID=2710758 RepID=A0A7S8E5V1_9CHLR|nr:cytochrome c-type biogenesis protein CcmH [Phototrophicus methaneseepsis]QPC80949.1 cytochrome c-type biogenesis protein CcmH [Phototrophicus methaneseepsis]